MPDPIVWSIALPYLATAFLFGYLLGSIPFGLVLTKLFGDVDVRSVGSGNIGATNVLRTGSKKLAAATLLGDLAKGAVAVWGAGQFGPDQAVLAGLGAFIGHCFPIWLKFKGGKGVATYIGVALAAYLPVAAVFAVSWLAIAFLFRISSLAALIASLITPVAFYWFGYVQWGELFILLTILLWLKHHENIKRLFQGKESKISI